MLSVRSTACGPQGAIFQFGGLDPHNEDHNTLHVWTPGSAGFEEVKTKGRLPPARCVFPVPHS